MEYENKYEHNYASRGQANLNTVLASIGSAGALGLLDNFLGNGKGHCSEDHCVNRYEAAQAARIAELETQNKLLESNIYTDSKIADVFERLSGRINCIEGQISQQAVYNASNTNMLNCLSNQVASLMSLTKVVIPTSSICPEVMPRYNSFVTPTTTAGA